MISPHNDFIDFCHENTKKLIDELIHEIEVLKDPAKLAFILYWKRIINIVHSYKEKLLTFAYVFIRPIIHIRTLYNVF